MEIRLQKILAQAGATSRRGAEEAIRLGRVTVNDQPAVIGQKADPDRDDIRLDGQPLASAEETVYLIYNKPAGVITTLSDPQGRPCLDKLIAGLKRRIFPVGRLDADTTGLLLLTNNGELTDRLLHPRYKVEKTYLVTVRGRADDLALTHMANGVMVGDRITAPAEVTMVKQWGRHSLIRMTIREGRKRQVRRMCGQVGLKVEELKRVRFGPLRLDRLPVGQTRPLSEKETNALLKAAGLAGSRSDPGSKRNKAKD